MVFDFIVFIVKLFLMLIETIKRKRKPIVFIVIVKTFPEDLKDKKVRVCKEESKKNDGE